MDFDTTVKLQDHISRRFDEYFSLFSIIGSAEITIGFCILLAILSLFKLKILPLLGWLMIIPASLGEVFGKLILFHPAPPNFLHRTLLPTGLPSFYVHTDFSYPSGHMTRIVFIATIFLSLIVFKKNNFYKLVGFSSLIGLIFLMALTRIYLGEHWLSDVLGGSILGAAVGSFASILILRPKLV